VSSESFAGKPLLVAFVCNHCPYVKHVERGFAQTLRRHPDLHVVGICSNDAAAYRDDAPAALAEQAVRAGWAFPYLIDESQEVGRAFNAACTPDFFLYGVPVTVVSSTKSTIGCRAGRGAARFGGLFGSCVACCHLDERC
jgi:hypothetical protein